MPNIVETAVRAGSFTTLVSAVQAAGLEDVLSRPGPFTVFAPSEEAFERLPEGTLEELLGNPPKLADVLKYHVVPGRYMSSDLGEMSTLRSLQGQEITISEMPDLTVEDARIVQADIEAANGVIHVIDSVMLPT